MNAPLSTVEMPETKRKLVDAGVRLIRAQGFNATSVDEVCEGAGVTKGAFFHYFKSKEDLAKAALVLFAETKATDAAAAPFRKLSDPLARVYGRLDYAKESSGAVARTTKGCLIGTVAQELAFTHPALRQLCRDTFVRMGQGFEDDLREAKARYAPHAAFDPASVAKLFVAIIQGSLVMAKAADSTEVLERNIDQFRHYLQTLFSPHLPASRSHTPSYN